MWFQVVDGTHNHRLPHPTKTEHHKMFGKGDFIWSTKQLNEVYPEKFKEVPPQWVPASVRQTAPELFEDYDAKLDVTGAEVNGGSTGGVSQADHDALHELAAAQQKEIEELKAQLAGKSDDSEEVEETEEEEAEEETESDEEEEVEEQDTYGNDVSDKHDAEKYGAEVFYKKGEGFYVFVKDADEPVNSEPVKKAEVKALLKGLKVKVK